MNLDFSHLEALLKKAATGPELQEFVATRDIERSAFQGFVEMLPLGLSLMFKEAPWVLERQAFTDASALYLSAIHFHRGGHEGHSQYACALPAGIRFGDSSSEVKRKLGESAASGGGGMSKVLKQPIPRWMKYPSGRAGIVIHLQFDSNDQLELLTLMADAPKASGDDPVPG